MAPLPKLRAALHVLGACVLASAAAVGCSTQLEAPDSTFAEKEAKATPTAELCAACGVHFEHFLTAPKPQPHVRFGQAVALSGTSVAVAAPFEHASGKPDDPDAAASMYVPRGEGVTYLFDVAEPERAPLRIVAPNADPGDAQVPPQAVHLTTGAQSELNLALNEDFLVVGVAGEDSALGPGDDVDDAGAQANNDAQDAGAVYVYARADLERGTLTPLQYLKAPSIAAGDLFGASVALSGSRLVIGAPGRDDLASDSGAAYVYELEHDRFVFRQMLKPSGLQSDDFFGVSVAIDGDLLVAGAAGDDNGSTEIDAKRDDTPVTSNGAAYVFRWESEKDRWELDAYLKPKVASMYGLFGVVVRVSQQRVAVSSPDASQCPDQPNASPLRGAVYVFRRDEGGWVGEGCLGPRKRQSMDLFGYSLGLSGDTLALSAPWDDSGADDAESHSLAFSGAAYLAAYDTSSWHDRARIKAPNVAAEDVFGVSLALGPQLMVVGASQSSHGEDGEPAPTYSGAVYVFGLDQAAPRP